MEKMDAVFTQRSCEDGLTQAEITDLLRYLCLQADEEVVPVIISGDNAAAFGFIRNNVIASVLNDDIGADAPFSVALRAVVNDMALETPGQHYDFAGVRTFMYY